MRSESIAICESCKERYYVGDVCKKCSSGNNFISYAQALKDAVQCWNSADCQEHPVPCQPALKEFANKFLDLQERIKTLEKAIFLHKEKKSEVADQFDLDLWKVL